MLIKILAQATNPSPPPAPDSAGSMPFVGLIGQVLGYLLIFGLAMCVAGLILSAGMWAIGAFSNNYTQSVNGKKGFLICAASALIIGAAYAIVSMMYSVGSGVQ